MRRRFVYEAFRSNSLLLGCSTRRDLHFSSLGFSNRASTDVTPKQKGPGSHKFISASPCQCLLNHHIRSFRYEPAISMSDLQPSETPTARIHVLHRLPAPTLIQNPGLK